MLHLKTVDIRIPFCGFYESEASYMIDQEIEQSFDYEGSGMSDIPEDFYNHWDHKPVSKAFAEEYTPVFQDWFNSECSLDIVLNFKELYSPRFYNFETDTITCTITQDDVLKLWRAVDKNVLALVIKERFSDRSGFISHYEADMYEDGSNKDYCRTVWTKPVFEWDCIQLETLLIAVMVSNGIQDIDYYELMEPMSCNGVVHMVVWNNCSKECLDMINSYDEAREA